MIIEQAPEYKDRSFKVVLGSPVQYSEIEPRQVTSTGSLDHWNKDNILKTSTEKEETDSNS